MARDSIMWVGRRLSYQRFHQARTTHVCMTLASANDPLEASPPDSFANSPTDRLVLFAPVTCLGTLAGVQCLLLTINPFCSLSLAHVETHNLSISAYRRNVARKCKYKFDSEDFTQQEW